MEMDRAHVVESSSSQDRCRRRARLRVAALTTVLGVVVGALALGAPAQASPDPDPSSTSIVEPANAGGGNGGMGFDMSRCNGNAALRPAVVGTVSATNGTPMGGSIVFAEQEVGEEFALVACAFTNPSGAFALAVTASAFTLITIDAPTSSAHGGAARVVTPEQFPEAGLTSGSLDLGRIDLSSPINVAGVVTAPPSLGGGPIPPVGTPGVPAVLVCLEPAGSGPQMPVGCSALRTRGSSTVSAFVLAVPPGSLAGSTLSAVAYSSFGEPIGSAQRVLTGNESAQDLMQLAVGPLGGDDDDGDDGGSAGNGCGSNQTPDLTGVISGAGGAAYPTTVSVLASWSPMGDSDQRYRGEVSLILQAATDGSGAYGFCTQGLGSSIQNTGWVQAFAVQAASTDSTFGHTTGTWRARGSCNSGSPCTENLSMRNRILAGAVQLPPGELLSGGDSLAVALRRPNPMGPSQYLDATIVTDRASQNRAFSLSVPPTGALTAGTYELTVKPEAQSTMLIGDSYAFTVGDGGAVTPGPRFGPGSTATNLVVTLSAANVTGAFVQSNGSAYPENTQLMRVDLVKDDPSLCPIDDFYSLAASCFGVSDYWSYGAKSWKASLTDGNWIVRAEIDGLTAVGRFSVSGSTLSSADPNVDVLRQTPHATEPMLRVRVSGGNFRALPVRPALPNASVSGLQVQVGKWNGNWFNGVSGNLREDSGELVMNITETGIYQFTFGPRMLWSGGGFVADPSAPSDVASTAHTVRITVAGGSASISDLCTVSYDSGPATPLCTPTSWATVSAGASQGAYRFDLDVANLQVRVCAPASGGDSCPSVSQVSVELMQSNGEWFNYNRNLTPAGGWARLRLSNTTPGGIIYQLKARPPHGNPNLWTSPSVTFKVGPGATPEISNCPAQDVECTGAVVITPVGGVVTLPDLQFQASTLFASVLEPGTGSTPVAQAWVQIMRVDEQSMQHLGGGESNTEGRVALGGIVTQAGTYRLEANPPWNSTAGFTSTSRTFRVTGSAGTLAIHVEDSPLVVRLGQPNVSGRVCAGSCTSTNGVAFANINVEQWSDEEQQWRWANRWTNADNRGNYRITLPVGRWRLRSEPQPQQAALFSAGLLEVTVTPDNVASVQANQNIALQAPNLRVRVTNGVGGAAVQWANIWTQRYDTQLGYFAGGDPGGNTDVTGFTALNLTATGVYRVEVMPRPNAGLTRATAFVSVSAGTPARICQVASLETATTCVGGQLDGSASPLVIALAGPNLRGSLQAGGVTVSGWVNLDRYNAVSGRYEWGELWADSNNRDGFTLKLETGAYRLMATPRTAGQYSRTTVFVTISASATEWCRFGADPIVEPGQSPTACSGTTPRLDVVLTGANVVGGVTNGITGTSVSASWVNVERWDAGMNRFNWTDSHGDVQNGRFALTLEPSELPYRLTVNPPFGNSGGVTRLRRAMWVMSDNSICITTAAENGDARPVNCAGGTAFASGATQHFVMTGGNVSGVVQFPAPTGGTARDAEISVEIQEGTFFRHTENWTRTSGSGSYSVNLITNGTYRITARPPWGVSGQFSPVSTTIVVTGCPGACSSHTANLTLSSPNVVLTLQNPLAHASPGATVADAWIQVERRDGDRWTWTNTGANSSRAGTVAFSLDAGEYRFWVNPPWNRSDLARFSTTIVVGGDPVAQSLRFPSPNLSVPVLDPLGQRVPNVWAYARRLVGDRYDWADIYGNGSQTGMLSMSLTTDGQYQVVVEPPPGRSNLGRVSVDVTVSGGVLTPPLASISFPTANVTGSARIGSPTGTLARFGWVEIRRNGNFVDGLPVRDDGRFSTTLADGVYELVVHPNFSQTQQPPIRLDVTVSGSNPLVWRYQGDPGSETSGPLDVYFGRTQRNVRVTVTGAGGVTVGAGAFVTFLDTTTNATFGFVTDADGVAEGVVPTGTTYTISAVAVSGSSVRAGSLTSQSVTVAPAPTVASPDTYTVTVTAVS